MAPKKKGKDDTPSATPVPDDPHILALREAQGKRNAEKRAAFEQEEVIARRRIDAMENVDFRCVMAERERRLNPDEWRQKTAVKGPIVLHVKLLTGNRAIPQTNFRVEIPSEPGAEVSLLHLKALIREEAMRHGEDPERYSPVHQRLFLFGREIVVSDEIHTTTKTLNIGTGMTLQLALTATPSNTFPAQIYRQPRPPKSHLTTAATAPSGTTHRSMSQSPMGGK